MIWIDLENSPHVLFFLPIIARLRERGHEVLITARDFAQTVELLEMNGIDYELIGGRVKGGTVRKAIGTVRRGAALWRYLHKRSPRPRVSMGHGSRGQLVAATLLRIPALTSYDYEYVDSRLHNRLAARVYVPSVLSDDDLDQAGINRGNLARYPGLKEELYLRDFRPDPEFPATLGLDLDKVIAVVRPPSTSSHYHDTRAERLTTRLLTRLADDDDVQCVVLPRYPEQRDELARFFAEHGSEPIMPERAVDGLNLVHHADLVVSGGGTMIREAAVLGVPAYTIFQGTKGAVDRHLSSVHRLTFVDTEDDVDAVALTKKGVPEPLIDPDKNLADFFVAEIEKYLDS